jgi:peptidoglycan/LPS O-acetylase OafA/YrhL
MTIYEREKTDEELLAEEEYEEEKKTRRLSNAVLFISLGILAFTVSYFTTFTERDTVMHIVGGLGTTLGFFAISGILATFIFSRTGDKRTAFVIILLLFLGLTVITTIYKNKNKPKYTSTPTSRTPMPRTYYP